MKKLIVLVLVIVSLVTLAGCSGSLVNPNNGSTDKPAATQQPTVAPTEEPIVALTEEPTVATTEEPVAVEPTGKTFQSPVKCATSFKNDSSWIICEPGVLLDNATAWTVAQVDAAHFVNVPEGAFSYFSLGEGDIEINDVTLHLEGEKGLNYLVLIRGKIDDTIVDNDLNMTAKVTGFVPGHAIWSHMPTGAYVSYDWFMEQLVASSTGGFTNCGATGCSRIRIVLYDVDSGLKQVFEVKASNLTDWTLLESNQ